MTAKSGITRPFLTEVRVHNHVLLELFCSETGNYFRSNPWTFTKLVCEGNSAKQLPQFSAQSAFDYYMYKSSFSKGHSEYTLHLDWVSEVMPINDLERDFDNRSAYKALGSLIPDLLNKAQSTELHNKIARTSTSCSYIIKICVNPQHACAARTL